MAVNVHRYAHAEFVHSATFSDMNVKLKEIHVKYFNIILLATLSKQAWSWYLAKIEGL